MNTGMCFCVNKSCKIYESKEIGMTQNYQKKIFLSVIPCHASKTKHKILNWSSIFSLPLPSIDIINVFICVSTERIEKIINFLHSQYFLSHL